MWIQQSIIALLVVGIIALWLRNRAGRKLSQIAHASSRVQLADIAQLCRECEHCFDDKLQLELPLCDLGDASTALRVALSNRQSLIEAFSASSGDNWHAVLPLGAVIGELLKLHAGGHWHIADGGELQIRFATSERKPLSPFQLVIDHLSGKQDLNVDRLFAPALSPPRRGARTRARFAA